MRRLLPAAFLWCAFLSVPLMGMGCVSCTKGKFCDDSKPFHVSCESCPAGKFQSSVGQRDCVTCAEGKYQSEKGADACIDCSTGRYQDAEQQATCKPCEAGQSAQTEGSSACKPCPEGRYQDQSAQPECKSCTPSCPSGTYLNKDACGGQSKPNCKDCPAGKYSTMGETSCKECAEGKFQDQVAQDTCEQCPKGKYAGASAGQKDCKKCEAGKFQDEMAKFECKSCAAGQYQSQEAEAACSGCDGCPEGRFRDSCGSDSAGACSGCAAGEKKALRGDYDTKCENCTKGHYQDVTGQASCKPCVVGRYQANPGGLVCTECEQGQVQVSPQQDKCTECAAGSFQKAGGKGYCDECNVQEPCPVGKWRSSCEKESPGHCEACTSCPDKQFRSGCSGQERGQCTECAACPAGKHRSGCEKQSAGTCEVCAHGTFKSSASDSGCETCALCPAGQSYWRAGCKDADKGECDDCAEGRFRTDKNAPALCEECAVCPPGKYLHGCNATTAGECKNCTSGFFKQIAGAWNTVCEACLYACQPGQELLGCGGSNNGICTDCPSTPSTKYRDGVNASVTTCRDCEACSKEGQFRYGCTRFSGGSCVACPAAKYQDQVGGADTKCKACESCGSGAAYNPTCGGSSKGECIPLQCAEGQYVDQAKVQDSGGLVDGCTVCESCDFGKERTGCGGNSTGTCIQCQEGMFKDSGLESGNGKEWWKKCERCKGCEAGYERKSCGDTNSGTCSPCPVGKYKSSYSGEISAALKCGDCTQCAAGKYRVGCGNDIPGTCERCPPGQYKTDVGKWNDTCEKCKTCPKGQERMSCTLTSAGQCRDCQTGFYKLVAGTTMCEPCSSCGEGAVRLDCGGSYSGQCESPKQGEYKNTTGEWNTTARSCDPCDQGTHRSECGGSSPGSCKTCVGGRFKLSKGSWDSTCEDFQGCKKGLYRTNTSVISVGACTPCPAGRYKDTEGSWNTKCSECSYCGEKQRSQGCGGANRGQCSHCTVGKYNDVKSGPWHTACKLCDEGHFCSEGAMKLCPPGRYSSVPGGEECRDCSAGSFGVAYGATAANCSGLCRAGYVCTAGSKTDAPPGNKCGASARETPALHFCPEGSSAPTQVALGFFTTPESSDEMTRTGEKMCDAGTYCEDGTQKDCPVGHRCPAKSVAPLPCGSVNVFCEQNSENATEVSAGYFTTSTSSSSEILRDAQETCAIGHQCVGGKMLPCPKGQYQDLEAQSSCKQCKKGRYGNEMGISTDACTETCPTNFYCPAGTATPLFCPKDNSTFCRQGSSEITTISLGHWIDKSGGDGNWSQKACAPGFYCPGNVRIECPAGYYCASLATAPIACGAERFYCPAGSAAKIPVALGHFSAGSNSTTNRTRQELCGAGSYYCVLGKRRQAKTGYYTAPESINATARWMEIMCEEGFRCINGTRIECDDGYKCRAGLDRQEACGSPSRFCKKGVEKLVDVGHYSIGANLQATPANADIRTDQAECPQGHFCRQGVMHECGEQGANESVFCEASASEPKRVAEGSYSGPLHESVLTRYWSTLCACPENKTDCGAPAFDFFCAGDGKRQKMANNFTAVVLKVEMTSEGQKANNFSVVGKRPCGTRQLCKDGTAQECPDGYKCLQNTKFRCNAGDTGKFGTCTTCPDKHYELNRTECKPCPQEGVICSNGKLVTKLDYWYEFEAMRDAGRVIDANTAFYKCKFDGICSLNTTGAGSLPGLPTVNCKEGFAGIKCGVCATGYGRSVGNTCKPCPSESLLKFGSIALVFAICAALVVILKYGLRKTERSEHSPVATMKIFVNYLYLVSLLGSIDIDWSEKMKVLFATSKTASGGAISFADCFDMDYFNILRFYFFFIPFIIVAGPSLIVAVAVCWHGMKGKSGSLLVLGMKPRACFRNGVLVLGYLAWPSIARQALEVLHCTQIGRHSVLEANHSVFCEGPTYDLWRGLAVTVLCTLVPGFPAVVFTLLYRNQKKIAQGKHADDPAFRDKYVFFFGGFKPSHRFWEICIMTRKVAMAAVVTMFTNTRSKQLYFGLWLLLIIFFSHVVAHPYSFAWKGMLETMALGAVLMSLLLGSALAIEKRDGTPRLDARANAIVTVLIYFIHVPLIMLFCTLITKEASVSTSKKIANMLSEPTRKLQNMTTSAVAGVAMASQRLKVHLSTKEKPTVHRKGKECKE